MTICHHNNSLSIHMEHDKVREIHCTTLLLLPLRLSVLFSWHMVLLSCPCETTVTYLSKCTTNTCIVKGKILYSIFHGRLYFVDNILCTVHTFVIQFNYVYQKVSIYGYNYLPFLSFLYMYLLAYEMEGHD